MYCQAFYLADMAYLLVFHGNQRPLGMSCPSPVPAYLSLRLRRNLLYDQLAVFSSKLLHQCNQLDQVLVAKETSAAGHRHKRIFRRHRGPARWKGAQPSLGIVKVNAVLAPVVAIRNQLELLASQRVVWVDDFKNGIGMVAMRCS
jgi:hypothetical protein